MMTANVKVYNVPKDLFRLVVPNLLLYDGRPNPVVPYPPPRADVNPVPDNPTDTNVN